MVFYHMQDLFLTVLTSVNVFRVESFPKFLLDFQLFELKVSLPKQFSDLVIFTHMQEDQSWFLAISGLLFFLHVTKTEVLVHFSHMQGGCFIYFLVFGSCT